MTDPGAEGALRELLAVERQCCADLAALLERERAAVLSHDLDGLLGTVREREALQARWQGTARRRASVLASSGRALRDVSQGDAEMARLVDDLARETTALRRAQDINRGLVAGVLATVSDLLAEVRRGLPGARYDRGACLSAPLPELGSSSFRA